jgi:hypothetical protein
MGGLVLAIALVIAAAITAGHVLAWFGTVWIFWLVLIGVALFALESRRKRS